MVHPSAGQTQACEPRVKLRRVPPWYPLALVKKGGRVNKLFSHEQHPQLCVRLKIEIVHDLSTAAKTNASVRTQGETPGSVTLVSACAKGGGWVFC